MSNKSYKSGLFKRIIDLGVVSEADVDDLVRIWRVATGDEKAITLQNFVQTVNTELGTGGLTLTEIVAIIDAEVAGISGDFVTLTTDQTITGEKKFDAKTIIGDSSTDYVLWDKIAKVFSIFTQAQFIHKYRGGAAGSLNIGQYDIDGNASVNNTSNGKLLLGTNNTTRVEIEADGDVLLKKVDSGTGETLMIEPSGRVVKGSGGGRTEVVTLNVTSTPLIITVSITTRTLIITSSLSVTLNLTIDGLSIDDEIIIFNSTSNFINISTASPSKAETIFPNSSSWFRYYVSGVFDRMNRINYNKSSYTGDTNSVVIEDTNGNITYTYTSFILYYFYDAGVSSIGVRITNIFSTGTASGGSFRISISGKSFAPFTGGGVTYSTISEIHRFIGSDLTDIQLAKLKIRGSNTPSDDFLYLSQIDNSSKLPPPTFSSGEIMFVIQNTNPSISSISSIP